MKIRFAFSFSVHRDEKAAHEVVQEVSQEAEAPAIYDLSGAHVERGPQFDFDREPVRLGFQPRKQTNDHPDCV